MAARSLRSLAQNASLSVATLLLFVAGAEGICRLLEPQREAVPAVAPSITDWAQWEGDFYTVKATAVGWPPFEDYNQEGLRDREHAVEKPAGVRRIVFLGDSTTVGYRIRPEEAYPQVLQDRLDALGQRTEVFNVALGRLVDAAGAHRLSEDRPPVPAGSRPRGHLPQRHTRDGEQPEPPARVDGGARPKVGAVRRVVAAPQREIRSVEELFLAHESPKVKAAYQRFFSRPPSAARRWCEQDGARFGMLVFPFRLQVEPAAAPRRPQEKIAAFCAAERIPVPGPAARPA